MNERILNLARIAQGNNPADYAPDDNVILLATQDVEKFAQLIVRECMNICAEREEDCRTRIKDNGKAATAYMCRAYIKEHFGVE